MSNRWQTLLVPESSGDRSISARLARTVAIEIRRGRFRPGTRLPGTREVAGQLRVHRATVMAAWAELQGQGWVETRHGSGTYVADPLPRTFYWELGDRVAGAVPAEPAYAVEPRLRPRLSQSWPAGTLVMAGGLPDLRLVPVETLARAWRRGLQHGGRRLLGYGDPQGLPLLRETLAEMLRATRGLACGPDELIVTRGSQMALHLAAQALVRPGDRVAVEELGYGPAWAALRAAGAELLPVAVDGGGMDVAALERALGDEGQHRPLRAVYLTPHHQYPSTAILEPARRLRLLDLAARHRFAVIEDDYDHEYHYEGAPVLPLAALDRLGSVLYIGTLSKVLAPGLRVGWAVAPRPVIEAMVATRIGIDRQGDRAGEHMVAELLRDGDLQRHARRVRKELGLRRDALASALREELGGVVDFALPPGGMALWARVDGGVDPRDWAARAAREHAVVFQPGADFDFDGRSLPFVRLGFGLLEPKEIREAVRRMRGAL
jgi:GntR family transcriptional regulator/MocR family aminotransferase